jgi:hypothetical protein
MFKKGGYTKIYIQENPEVGLGDLMVWLKGQEQCMSGRVQGLNVVSFGPVFIAIIYYLFIFPTVHSADSGGM